MIILAKLRHDPCDQLPDEKESAKKDDIGDRLPKYKQQSPAEQNRQNQQSCVPVDHKNSYLPDQTRGVPLRLPYRDTLPFGWLTKGVGVCIVLKVPGMLTVPQGGDGDTEPILYFSSFLVTL